MGRRLTGLVYFTLDFMAISLTTSLYYPVKREKKEKNTPQVQSNSDSNKCDVYIKLLFHNAPLRVATGKTIACAREVLLNKHCSALMPYVLIVNVHLKRSCRL